MTGNVEDNPVHRLTANDKLKVRAFVREEDAQPGADGYGWERTA